MSLVTDAETAAEYLERLQSRLWEIGDHSRDDDIASIICMLDSPLFKCLLTLEESMQDLNQLSKTQPLTEDNFDFMPTGELILAEGYPGHDVSAASTLSLRTPYAGPGSAISTHSYNIEFQRSLDQAAKGREMETISLYKPENTSLGFSVVGLRDEEKGELGIYVQDIQPAGIAALDGRLREGDQLLAIDGQPLDISHQQAIHILQNSQGPVQIVVARGPIPQAAAAGAAPETGGGGAGAGGAAAGGAVAAEDEEETLEVKQKVSLSLEQSVDLSNDDSGAGQADKTDMVLSADWTQLEVIDLINDGTGLGFGIIGGRSTGVVVKTILPGGVADLEGHLRSGDHILQIGDVNVRGMSSEQVALVLRQSGSHVRLIVARSILEPPPYQIPNAPIIPTHQLDEHIAHINLLMEQSEVRAAMDELAVQQLQMYPHLSSIMGQVQVHPQPYDMQVEIPEVELFEVDLIKDTRGLGITIAGYVGGDNTPDEISGIFVKSISPGSAAAQDGRIQVNDQIIEVDGRSLQGYTNHQAVEVLRNTGQSVHLRLVRFQHGPKYEKLQQYLAQANQNSSAMAGLDVPAVSNPTYELDNGQVDVEDVSLTTAEDDYSGELRPDVEAAIKSCWERIVGPDCEVVVAQLSKFREGGGLGISLEGTVDVENGQEVRPHHYIGSIRPDGPVGQNGRLKTNDELLEVNGKRLLGLNHVSVVEILKHSPQHVRLVCARRKSPPQADLFSAQSSSVAAAPFLPSPSFQEAAAGSLPGTERLIKAKSEQALSTSDAAPASTLNKGKSRSLEPLTGLAMWSSEPAVIELEKGDRGLGFSILDYQDPMNPNETVIVIRSLVPGGVAQQDGRLVPGDRLVFVNNTNLEQASLDEAAQALKGAPKGIVRIGVAKPLPLSDTPFRREQQFSFGSQNHQVSEHAPFPSALMSELTSALRNHMGGSSAQAHSESRLESVGPSVVPANVQGSWDSSSSDTEYKSSGGSTMQRKDSFYESDEDMRMPVYVSPRKQKTEPEEKPPSYESAVEVLEMTTSLKSPVVKTPLPPVPPPAPPHPPKSPISPPLRAERPTAHIASYENVSRVGHDLIFHMSEGAKIESMAPLPSYEEAVLGFGETDSLGDTPPVPPRAVSQENMIFQPLTVDVMLAPDAAEEFRLSDLESEQPPSSTDSPTPSMDKSSSPTSTSTAQTLPGGRAGRAVGPRPPIPPKPRLPKHVSGKQEPPPPLPGTSPPPPQAVPPSPPVFPTTPPLRPAPSSPRHGPDSRLGGRVYHRKSGSQDSSASSSSDHAVAAVAAALGGATSDLRSMSSPPASPHTVSPRLSPMGSPLLHRSDGVPSDLERAIKVCKGSDQLGVTVETVDRGMNGCIVKSVVKGGAIEKDGRLQVGDYIVSINNESLRHITNAQARAILRRTSLLNTDISITYIPGSSVAAHGSLTPQSVESSPSHVSMPSPSAGHIGSASPVPAPSSPSSSVTSSTSATSTAVQQLAVSSHQKSLTVEGSQAVGSHAWGPARTVELLRQEGKSLGISIVGGRVDMFNVHEHAISGIFIKHVLEDSPAKANASLKTGDRILEVNGVDVRNATHDEAVEVIRNAASPVKFMVQSLVDSSCPGDLDPSQLKSVQSFEEAAPSQMVAPLKSQSTAGDAPSQQIFDGSHSVKEEGGSDSESEDEYGYTLRKLQRKYGDQAGTIQLIEFPRSKSGIGLSLAGNKDRSVMSVFVAGIQPDSPAAKDGRMQVGDELLEINGNVLYGRSHLNASATIKSLTTPSVKLVISRHFENVDRMAIKPLRLGPLVSPEGEVARKSQEKDARKESAVQLSADSIQVITLHKQGTQGLGFGIMEETRDGHHGIYVRSVTIGGAAAKEGQLSVGDEVMAVGEESIQGLPYEKAMEVLRRAQGTVHLKVRKCGSDETQVKTPVLSQGSLHLSNSGIGESSTDPVEEQAPVDPLTCSIVPGRETYIEIEKGRTGLGLSIVGGSDTLLGAIIIHEVYTDGAAARDARLWAGDQILEVNNEDLREATHDRAIQILRQTPSRVGLLIYRDDQQAREEDLYDVFTVELIKRPGKGLGLSIVGKKNDVGVYISDIVKGGVAEADGRLMQGDQILAVNGEDMRNATQEYAAGVLKTLMGKVSLMVGRLKAGSRTSSRKNSGSTGLKKSDSSASNRSKGKHSKSQSDEANLLRTVELEHDLSGSLGISIAGGLGSPLGDVPIIVASLNPDGPAARCGKLRVGDKILMINGQSTHGMEHAQAVQLLKSGSPVILQVMQGEDTIVSVSGGRPRQVYPEVPGDSTLQKTSQEPEEDGHPPQNKLITLERGPDGLGFSIVGGHGSPHGDLPIYVKNVFAKGAAADNGELHRGDQILSVNGVSLEGVTHEEAVNILKNARGKVTLSVIS